MPRRVVEAEGQVRLALADAREAERRFELRQTLGQPRRQPRKIDAARCRRRCVIGSSTRRRSSSPVPCSTTTRPRRGRRARRRARRPSPAVRAGTDARTSAASFSSVEQLGGHLAREPARRDRVHTHAVDRPLRRELAGESVHRALRRDVAGVRNRRRGDRAEHRADVDHRAARAARASELPTACETAKSASRFTRRTERKPSSVAWRSGPPDEMPALLTQTSTRPNRSSVSSTSRARAVVCGHVAVERVDRRVRTRRAPRAGRPCVRRPPPWRPPRRARRRSGRRGRSRRR